MTKAQIMPPPQPLIKPSELGPLAIRLPDSLKAPTLAGGPKAPVEEGWSPKQIELAQVLQEAFTGSIDSSGVGIDPTHQVRNASDIQGVQIDVNNKTVTFKGETFQLPPALVVNPETKQIRYMPNQFGTPTAVLAQATQAKVQAQTNPGLGSQTFVPVNDVYKGTPPAPKPGDITTTPKTITPNQNTQPNSQTQGTTEQQRKVTQQSNNQAAAAQKTAQQTQKGVDLVQRANEENRQAGVAAQAAAAEEAVNQARNILSNTAQSAQSAKTESSTAVNQARIISTGTGVVTRTAQAKNRITQQQSYAAKQVAKETDQTKVTAAKAGSGTPGKSQK